MKTGSLVECIDDSKPLFITPLKKGVVYTVRAIVSGYPFREPGVYLEEIIAPRHEKFNLEYPFRYERFRELLPPIENVEQWVNENTHELQPVNK